MAWLPARDADSSSEMVRADELASLSASERGVALTLLDGRNRQLCRDVADDLMLEGPTAQRIAEELAEMYLKGVYDAA